MKVQPFLLSCFVLGGSAWLTAQQPASAGTDTFSVASIKTIAPDGAPVVINVALTGAQPGGRYRQPAVTLSNLIAFAYDLDSIHTQLAERLPAWAKSQRFDVECAPPAGFPDLPPAENQARVRSMVRDMLTTRFHLKAHQDTRDLPIYRLRVAPSGAKLVAAPASGSGVSLYGMANGGILAGKGATLDSFASSMSTYVRRTVVNDTGLTGTYDFKFRWSAPDGGDPADANGLVAGTAALFPALASGLGLKLISARGPVQVLVVDSVSQPIPN